MAAWRTSARLRLIVCAMIAGLASGCGSIFTAQNASDLPEEKLAIVEETDSIGAFFLIFAVGGYRVNVLRIDGEQVSTMARVYRVRPGAHIIESRLMYDAFSMGLGEAACYCEATVRLEASEGKRYVLVPNTQSKPVELQIKQQDTDIVVARAVCERTSWAWC